MTNNKRKRGRSKKESKQLPKFKPASDVKKYLINEVFFLILEKEKSRTKKIIF